MKGSRYRGQLTPEMRRSIDELAQEGCEDSRQAVKSRVTSLFGRGAAVIIKAVLLGVATVAYVAIVRPGRRRK